LIYTITPNPVLDICGIVDELVTDEKNYVRSEERFPGGNAINVARLLTRLGVPVTATGFLGQSVGREIEGLLDVEKVRHSFVPIADHTRISVTVSNSKTHLQTRLSFAGPTLKQIEIQQLKKRAAALSPRSTLVLGGSFPPGFKISDAKQLIKAARKRDIPVIVDVPGDLLRKLDLKGVTLIKPNLVEFQELIGRKLTTVASVARAARRLASKVDLVCVSSVGGGAILASRDFVCFGKTPPIKIKTTVGAGDSMVAGMVAELWRRNTTIYNDRELVSELLRHGLAAAAATLSTSGTTLGRARDVVKYYGRINVSEFSG
jgi:1-phosphofructokinase family hexose kinase